MKTIDGFGHEKLLTKYVVGENANPPKNPNNAEKKGKVIATNIVKPAIDPLMSTCKIHFHDCLIVIFCI